MRLADRIELLITGWVKGKTLDEATTIKNTEIAQELSPP